MPRIKRIPHAFANEDEQAEHQSQDKEAGETEPGRVNIGFALRK